MDTSFAAVGSMDGVQVKRRWSKLNSTLAVLYTWKNENHCDFVKLWEKLTCTNMKDLWEQTHTRHYKLYRCWNWRKWALLMGAQRISCSIFKRPMRPKDNFYAECQREEEEMNMLVQWVKEKEAIMEEAKRQLQASVGPWKEFTKKREPSLKKREDFGEKKKKEKNATSKIYQNQTLMVTGGTLKRDKDHGNSNFMLKKRVQIIEGHRKQTLLLC